MYLPFSLVFYVDSRLFRQHIFRFAFTIFSREEENLTGIVKKTPCLWKFRFIIREKLFDNKFSLCQKMTGETG